MRLPCWRRNENGSELCHSAMFSIASRPRATGAAWTTTGSVHHPHWVSPLHRKAVILPGGVVESSSP